MAHSTQEKINYKVATHVWVAMHFLAFFDKRCKEFPDQSLSRLFSDFSREMPTAQNKLSEAGVFILFLQFTCIQFKDCMDANMIGKPIAEVKEFQGIKVVMPVGKLSVKNVIRRMRNSLAHTRYELRDKEITLKDVASINSEDTFELVATYEQLWEVVKYIFKSYVKQYNLRSSEGVGNNF
jgi:isopentenyl diphosphate isomerase/L-lactate dehydrogenase-like FMN-dependent dehydrogenase